MRPAEAFVAKSEQRPGRFFDLGDEEHEDDRRENVDRVLERQREAEVAVGDVADRRLAELELEPPTLRLPGDEVALLVDESLRDVRATGRDVVTGPDGLVAARVDPERIDQAAAVIKPVINWYSFALTSDHYNFLPATGSGRIPGKTPRRI